MVLVVCDFIELIYIFIPQVANLKETKIVTYESVFKVNNDQAALDDATHRYCGYNYSCFDCLSPFWLRFLQLFHPFFNLR